MVWPFSKKKKEQRPILVFKGGEAFLEYQCKFGHTEISPGRGIVACVVDAAKELGVATPVKRQPNGTQMAILKVASEDGGFLVMSTTATAEGDALQPGDYVVWVPMEHQAAMVDAIDGVDPRFGWIGFITAKIKAEIDPNGDQLSIICRYD